MPNHRWPGWRGRCFIAQCPPAPKDHKPVRRGAWVVFRLFLQPASAHGVSWWVNIPATSSPPVPPSVQLSAVIRAVQGLVGGWHLRGLLSQALMVLLHRRLSEICAKMERTAARFAAGRLWRRGPRLAAGDDAAGRPIQTLASRAGAALIWPRRFGWLVRLGSWQAAGYGSQLRFVLEQPEMVALLAASPQAQRTLLPLCRMLAIETSLLRPARGRPGPREVVAATAAKETVVVRKRVREPVDRGRIPLPLGLLSAARRQGFGTLR